MIWRVFIFHTFCYHVAACATNCWRRGFKGISKDDTQKSGNIPTNHINDHFHSREPPDLIFFFTFYFPSSLQFWEPRIIYQGKRGTVKEIVNPWSFLFLLFPPRLLLYQTYFPVGLVLWIRRILVIVMAVAMTVAMTVDWNR